MKQKYPAFFFITLFISTLFVFSACKKLNEATELGGNLIPSVDNVTTFDTTLSVEAYNDIFAPINDSIFSASTDEHFLGQINNDPLFGKTDARIFLELKPATYPFSFINKKDSLHIDSVVLFLDYVETYGDTTIAQNINVYELAQTSDFSKTKSYLIRENLFTKAGLLGSKLVVPQTLKDSVGLLDKDTIANALMIRLDDSFGQRLLNYDSTSSTGAYFNDSVFQSNFKGFALESTSGNAIMGFNLAGANTRLRIYYKDDNNDNPDPAKWDTAHTDFTFVSGSSANANYVSRDYSGTPLMAAQGGATPDNLVYIQNTPGTFATVKVPGLGSLNNCIVHRAELIAEEIYDVSDAMFPPPPFMYLDAYDATKSTYRSIPYDLNFDSQGSLNLGAFGILPYNSLDGVGNTVKTWRFNITRYVQHVVNDTEPVYDLRLSSPFYLKKITYKDPISKTDFEYGSFPISGGAISPINPAIAKGRVRLEGGTGTNLTNPHRMRIRIIYSKI